MLSTTFVILASISLTLPLNVAAGPACARRHWQAQACISACQAKWGWPGAMMGTDPWGSVMQPQPDGSSSITDAMEQACGSAIAAEKSASVSSTANAQPAQATSVSSYSSSYSASSSSSSWSSSSSSTSSKKHTSTSTYSTPPPPPTTTSTHSSSSSKPPPPPTTTSKPPPETTTSKEAPAPTSTSSSGGSSGGGDSGSSGSDESAYLPLHNSIRAQHGAGAMTWSDNLASKAQQWANGCVFKHSGGSLGPFGENIASGTADSFDAAAAINAWVDQNNPEEKYDPSNPQPSHFTQVVWKGSTQLGCAKAQCSFGHFHVCEYQAQGNVIGEFQQNVQL